MHLTALLLSVFFTWVLQANPPLPVTVAPEIKISPEKLCHVQMPNEVLEADKSCVNLDIFKCSKNVKNCKWRDVEKKCHGIVFLYCTNTLPQECDAGIKAVEKFPPTLPRSTPRFKCSGLNPIKPVRVRIQ